MQKQMRELVRARPLLNGSDRETNALQQTQVFTSTQAERLFSFRSF